MSDDQLLFQFNWRVMQKKSSPKHTHATCTTSSTHVITRYNVTKHYSTNATLHYGITRFADHITDGSLWFQVHHSGECPNVASTLCHSKILDSQNRRMLQIIVRNSQRYLHRKFKENKRRFMAVFTKAQQWFLPWARRIQFTHVRAISINPLQFYTPFYTCFPGLHFKTLYPL
jgi:hypothetical protein